jgi:uncharacterized membrane protein YdjX (TVP38/TMEM64 family)
MMKKLICIRQLKTLRTVFICTALLVLLWHYHMPLLDAIAMLRDPRAVTNYLHGFGAIGPVILFFLLLVQVFLALVPGHALMMASGYIYGAKLTIAVVATSTILGSQLAFFLARKYGRRLIHKLASPTAIDRWDRVAGNRGGLFFFFTFVIPIFPADMMCYVAGLGTVPAREFFVANVAGRLLAATAMTLIGSFHFHPPLWFWLLFIVCVVLLVMAWGLYNKSFNRLPTRSDIAHACGLGLLKINAWLYALQTGLEKHASRAKDPGC